MADDTGSTSSVTMISITEVIRLLGGFGRFQWLIVLSFCIMSPPQVFQILFMLFGGADPPWRCAVNATRCPFKQPMPFFHPARCMMNRSQWEFTVPKHFSIATEFDLQCSRAWMRHLMNSMIFVGWGVGAIALGWIADNYGRRFVIYASQVMVVVVGFVMAFLDSVALLIVCRFIIGLFIPAGVVQTLVLVSEYVDSKHRPIASLLLFVAFALGACLFALKAYFIRTWRLLLIACTAPYILTALSYFFVPESIRWIRVKGNKVQLMEIVQRIATWNKKTLPDDLTIQPPVEEASSSVVEIFRTRRIAMITCILGYTWCVNAMVYFSLIFASHDLGGSPYINLFLLMIINLPSNAMAMYFSNKVGRKPTVLVTMTLASILCGSIGFVPITGNAWYARITLAVLGDFFISISFSAIYVWALEIYTTDIRASAMGFLQVSSRIGAATAPWIGQALRYVHPAAPYAVMSGATLLAPIPLLMVPETKDMTMADVRRESSVFYQEGKKDGGEGGDEERKTLIEILKEQQGGGGQHMDIGSCSDGHEDDSEGEEAKGFELKVNDTTNGGGKKVGGSHKRRGTNVSFALDATASESEGASESGKGTDAEAAFAPFIGASVFDAKRRMSEEISKRRRRKRAKESKNETEEV